MIDDDPRLFTAEIILNLLLSYKDIRYSVCVRVAGWVGWCVCVITIEKHAMS